MCNKCINNEDSAYLIEINGKWQTKFNGFTSNPNHYDLIKLSCKEDAKTVCEVLDLFSPVKGFKRMATEHIWFGNFPKGEDI